MDKEVVYMHNGILLSHKKEHSLTRWLNLKPIIQSEMSQKEKDKYHILMHKFGIKKNGTEEFIYRAAVEKQT